MNMSHKLDKFEAEKAEWENRGVSQMKRKAKAGAMTKVEIKAFFGHSFGKMPKKVKA